MDDRKYSVSLINEKWEIISGREIVKVEHLPRAGELIYLSDVDTYFEVVNVIHNLYPKVQGIFLVIKEYLR